MQSGFAGEVRSFIVTNFLLGREEGLNNEDSFIEKGIIDSTGILELVTYLEEEYAIEVTEEELIPDNLDSISRITAYLSRKLKVSEPITEPTVEDVRCSA